MTERICESCYKRYKTKTAFDKDGNEFCKKCGGDISDCKCKDINPSNGNSRSLKVTACKRCDKLNHKIKCLVEELKKHQDKHKSMQKPKNLCTNCGKPIGKVGVMMPTINPKLRQMCLNCADKILKIDRKVRI